MLLSDSIIINKTCWYDINKTSEVLPHSLTEYKVAVRLMFFQNWWIFLFPSLSPANCSPFSSKGPGEKQDSVDGGWNQTSHKFIFAHLVLSSLPPTLNIRSRDPTKSSVTLPPQQTPSNTHMFDFTGEVAREPSHDGKANLFRRRNDAFSRKDWNSINAGCTSTIF